MLPRLPSRSTGEGWSQEVSAAPPPRRGLDQPKLEEGKEKESDCETVAAEKHFGGECRRISREDHWQIIWMNGIAARRSGALTLDSLLCYAS